MTSAASPSAERPTMPDGYGVPKSVEGVLPWSVDDGGGLRLVTPHRALAWFDFPNDCTRFRLASPHGTRARL